MTNCECIGLFLPLPFDFAAFGFGLGDCLGPSCALLRPIPPIANRTPLRAGRVPLRARFRFSISAARCDSSLLFAAQQFGFALGQSNGLRRFRFQLPAIQFGVRGRPTLVDVRGTTAGWREIRFLAGPIANEVGLRGDRVDIAAIADGPANCSNCNRNCWSFSTENTSGKASKSGSDTDAASVPGVGCEFASDRIAVRVKRVTHGSGFSGSITNRMSRVDPHAELFACRGRIGFGRAGHLFASWRSCRDCRRTETRAIPLDYRLLPQPTHDGRGNRTSLSALKAHQPPVKVYPAYLIGKSTHAVDSNYVRCGRNRRTV